MTAVISHPRPGRLAYAMVAAASLVACSTPSDGPTSSSPGALDPSAAPGLTLGALDAAPRTIPYGGYVDFDGEPVNASGVRFNFAIFSCATPASCGPPLWVARGTWSGAATWPQGWPAGANDHVALPIFAGRFTVELGAAGQTPLPEVLFTDTHASLYLGIRIEGSTLGSLQKLAPAFRSVTASEADRLRIRSALTLDDPAGGAAEILADDGVVIGHDARAPGDTLLRVGAETPTLSVTGEGVVVDGTLLVNGALGYLGRSPANPARSCGAILDAVPGSPDGVYWLSPDDGAAFQVTCDMTSGGLTFAAFERGAKRPIAWWDMETLRDGRIKDLVGSNDLDILGAPTSDAGISGQTFKIENAQQYFISKDDYASELVGAQPKSISAWVVVPSLGWADLAASVFGFGGTDATNCAFGLSLHGEGHFNFVGYNNDIASPWNITLNQWHHMVATYDGINATLYVDGALVARSVKALNTGTGYRKYAVGTASWFSAALRPLVRGRIDEPKVYDYALDPEEVRQLFVLGQRGAE
ncbi:MAG: hypothetical protein IT385_29720 [Deltaproteobacteria bacterium]|nr:hypothetical protein [Deltaproteobacteria bacterium]